MKDKKNPRHKPGKSRGQQNRGITKILFFNYIKIRERCKDEAQALAWRSDWT